MNVAALYVDPIGPYPRLVSEWYDEARDARMYAGPWPVVAHPPCGPWGRLKFLCTKQEKNCGPHAVAMVRLYGGVLEHPANSSLWKYCSMPRPGEIADVFGGVTYALRQVSWGHCCEKPTWIYVVGVDSRIVIEGIRTGGSATKRITNGPRGPQLKRATSKEASRSPPEFAAWLVSLAGVSNRHHRQLELVRALLGDVPP
jgi:hypothetical protein